MKRPVNIIQYELNRYKNQLEAIKVDDSYTQNEEARANIKAFYIFKIGELTAEQERCYKLELKRIKRIEVKGSFEFSNATSSNKCE